MMTLQEKREFIRMHAKSLMGLAAMYRIALTTNRLDIVDRIYTIAVTNESAMAQIAADLASTGAGQVVNKKKRNLSNAN